MRLLTIALVTSLAAAISCAAPSPITPDLAADSAAITSVIRQMESANNTGDVDGWVSLFDDGAVYMPPGGPAVTTREGLVDIATTGFSQAKANVTLTPIEIIVSGDWAFAHIAVGGDVTLVTSGELITIDIKEIAIFRRQTDGGWPG